MSSIFISYARVDFEIAQLIAAELVSAGVQVWWDSHIVSGEKFSDEIRNQIDLSTFVLVLWSKAGVQSDWVRAEADLARKQGKLLQFTVDKCELPLPFSQLHTLDISQHSPARPFLASVAESGPSLLALRQIVRDHVLSRLSTGMTPTAQRSATHESKSSSSLMTHVIAGGLALPIAGVSAAAVLSACFLVMPYTPFKFDREGIWGFGFIVYLTVPPGFVFWKIFRTMYKWFLFSVKSAA